MNLYPGMTPNDMVNCAVIMDAIYKQNYRLKASAKNCNSWLEMEIYNGSGEQNKAPIINYIATIAQGTQAHWAEKDNPFEAVDEVFKKVGITKVQQYIDLKTLTESLSQGDAQ